MSYERYYLGKRPTSHATVPGSVPACQLPEFPHVETIAIDFSSAGECRACLAALVALAINRPEIVGSTADGGSTPAPLSALTVVRAFLDVNDPLRVRCEQELLPLCAKAA